jgi:hypothetical protein
MAGYHQHISVRKLAGNGPNAHRYLAAPVDPGRPRVLHSRVDREPLGQALQIAGDAMSVSAEQPGEPDAARILSQPIFDCIHLPVRCVARDGETFLGDRGVHLRHHISRGLHIDEGREQQDASRKCNGSPAKGRGVNEIRKLHGD